MHERITSTVFQVGGGSLSSPSDCLVYAIDLGDGVLVDCGCGTSLRRILDNVRKAGIGRIHTLLLTHAHVDHIGAAAEAKRETGCRIAAHAADAHAIETGDPRLTAAHWYGVDLEELEVDTRIEGARADLEFAGGTLHVVHTPGHTPGSIAAYLDTPEGRVLFGQDIHGPFSPEFGSDVAAWRRSMAILLDLGADILCEGHYGVFRGKDHVSGFIQSQLAMHR